MKRLCVFDFDGTIVRSMEGLTQTAVEVLGEVYGIPAEPAARKYVETSGLPFCEQVEQLFPGDTRNERAAELFERRKLDRYFSETLEEGAVEIVDYLRSKKIGVAVSSSNLQEVIERFLERTPLRFDFALGYRKNFSKGADHFRFLMRELSLTSGEILFVGDSLKDAERALSSEIDFVGKTGLFTEKDFRKFHPTVRVIHHLSELKKIL